jgi:hypothetical protein
MKEKWSEFKLHLGQEFSLLHVIQSDIGSQAALYLKGNYNSFSETKAAGA